MKYFLEKEIILRSRRVDENNELIINEEVTKEKIIDTDNIVLYIRKVIYGMSGEEFGKYLGLKRQQISSLETGRTKITKLHILAIKGILLEDGHDVKLLNEYL